MKIRITLDDGAHFEISDIRVTDFELSREAIPNGDGTFQPASKLHFMLRGIGENALQLAQIPIVSQSVQSTPAAQIPCCKHEWRERKYGHWCAKCGETKA